MRGVGGLGACAEMPGQGFDPPSILVRLRRLDWLLGTGQFCPRITRITRIKAFPRNGSRSTADYVGLGVQRGCRGSAAVSVVNGFTDVECEVFVALSEVPAFSKKFMVAGMLSLFNSFLSLQGCIHCFNVVVTSSLLLSLYACFN